VCSYFPTRFSPAFFFAFSKKKNRKRNYAQTLNSETTHFIPRRQSATETRAQKQTAIREFKRETLEENAFLFQPSFSFSEGVFYTLFCAKEERDLI